MFRLFDKLYRRQGAHRYRVRIRSLAVVTLILLPAFMSLATLILAGPHAPSWLSSGLWGVCWLSIGTLFWWIAYSGLRTLRAVWRAIRGKPHELQTWREP
jgi:hypothetical protein